MANIVILINPANYPYHAHTSESIALFLSKQNHRVSIFDIDCEPYDYLCLGKIKALEPDVLITLDLAGFRFRTQAGEIAFNMLPTKNLNLIWSNKPEYSDFLVKKLSLSMLFYDVSGTDCKLPSIYPNLLYYKAFDSINHFPLIWEDFKAEALL